MCAQLGEHWQCGYTPSSYIRHSIIRSVACCVPLLLSRSDSDERMREAAVWVIINLTWRWVGGWVLQLPRIVSGTVADCLTANAARFPRTLERTTD